MFKKKPDFLSEMRKTSRRAPHDSVVRRIEILHISCPGCGSCTGGSWNVGKRALWAHSLHLLLMLKQRYSSHVRCQLTDICFQRASSNNPCVWDSLVMKKLCMCPCMCWQQAILMKYIFHTLQHMSCILTVPGGGWQKHVTVKRHTRINWCQKVTNKWSCGCGLLVMTNQFRLYSWCAQSFGYCKTLAPSLIKILIAESGPNSRVMSTEISEYVEERLDTKGKRWNILAKERKKE